MSEEICKNHDRKDKDVELSESQMKIVSVCNGMKDLLLYKNKKYGDSALHPENVFYKGGASDSIMIRLDDKLSRVRNGAAVPAKNDVADIIGYCVLLLVSMETTEEDFYKMKD